MLLPFLGSKSIEAHFFFFYPLKKVKFNVLNLITTRQNMLNFYMLEIVITILKILLPFLESKSIQAHFFLLLPPESGYYLNQIKSWFLLNFCCKILLLYFVMLQYNLHAVERLESQDRQVFQLHVQQRSRKNVKRITNIRTSIKQFTSLPYNRSKDIRWWLRFELDLVNDNWI